MSDATIWIDERPSAWSLALEPWALAFGVKPGERVRLDLRNTKPAFGLETSVNENGATYWFEEQSFSVTIGDTRHDFDFGDMSVDLFSQLR